MEAEEIMQKILAQEISMPHVEGHIARKLFIEQVIRCMAEDYIFRNLVRQQLRLYCKVPDSRTFCDTCNAPEHIIRNKMLVWHIDKHSKEA